MRVLDKLSALRLVQFLGNASYSLYLSHIVVKYFWLRLLPEVYPSAMTKVKILILSLVLAAFMYYCIEKLMRRLPLKLTFLFGVVAIVATVALSGFFNYSSNQIVGGGVAELEARSETAVDAELAFRDTGELPENVNDLCFGAVAVLHIDQCGGHSAVFGVGSEQSKALESAPSAQSYPECTPSKFGAELDHCQIIGDEQSSVYVILFGDSMIRQEIKLWDKIGKIKHWRIEVIAHSACGVVSEETKATASGSECTAVYEYFLKKRPSASIVFASFIPHPNWPLQMSLTAGILKLCEDANTYYVAKQPALDAFEPGEEKVNWNNIIDNEQNFYPELFAKGKEITFKKGFVDKNDDVNSAIGGVFYHLDGVHNSTYFVYTLTPILLDELQRLGL
ncbi:MAG: hypothetical protein LBQ41_04590 [Candidatus Ancillula sp.]|jgi:hypothetical protein|nr:hypothetical protein [Candidatus Ancillula sp.]